jgi:hypothetical protein
MTTTPGRQEAAIEAAAKYCAGGTVTGWSTWWDFHRPGILLAYEAALAEQPHSAEPDGCEAVSADDLAQAIDGVAEQPDCISDPSRKCRHGEFGTCRRCPNIAEQPRGEEEREPTPPHYHGRSICLGEHCTGHDGLVDMRLGASDREPDMHAAYLGRCIEADEAEIDILRAALSRAERSLRLIYETAVGHTDGSGRSKGTWLAVLNYIERVHPALVAPDTAGRTE